MAGIKTTELDKVGKKLAKLKAQKSKLEVDINKLKPDIYKLQDKFINMLLKADQDSWVMKGFGRLSLSTRQFMNVSDYKKFMKWASSAKAKKLGISLEVIESQTNVKLTKESGLGIIIEEFKAKNSKLNFQEKLGIKFTSKSNITYAPKSTKKK